MNASNHTKCVSLIQPFLVNLPPNEYSQEFYYYPFVIKLDSCVGNCNTLNDLSNKVYVLKKTEDLNLNMCNMIAGINELKRLTKFILWECNCRFDEIKCKSDQWWNSNKCWCECKKVYVCEKDYIWNSSTCNCENGAYLVSVMDDLVITCD